PSSACSFTAPPPPELYTLSLHDALPISGNYLAFFSSYSYLQQVLEALRSHWPEIPLRAQSPGMDEAARKAFIDGFTDDSRWVGLDRKSTRLNSSHVKISYAVFCLKKKKQ